MVTNTKEYMKEYMRKYNERNSYMVQCDLCGIECKKCNLHAHKRSKTHKLISSRINQLNNQHVGLNQ
jgi:uncharacterized Zn finger protein